MKLFKKYNLKTKEINHSIHVITNNEKFEILAQFLDYWNRAKDLREDFLPELNLVVDRELFSNDIGADVIGQAYIKHDITLLEMSDLGYLDMELPTEDFKGLILEWLNFLESHENQKSQS